MELTDDYVLQGEEYSYSIELRRVVNFDSDGNVEDYWDGTETCAIRVQEATEGMNFEKFSVTNYDVSYDENNAELILNEIPSLTGGELFETTNHASLNLCFWESDASEGSTSFMEVIIYDFYKPGQDYIKGNAIPNTFLEQLPVNEEYRIETQLYIYLSERDENDTTKPEKSYCYNKKIPNCAKLPNTITITSN